MATTVVAAREFVRTRQMAARVDASTSDGPGAAYSGHSADDQWIGGLPMTIALAVLALIVAAGSTATVYRIGHSGARAAWDGKYSQTAIPSPGKQKVGNE